MYTENIVPGDLVRTPTSLIGARAVAWGQTMLCVSVEQRGVRALDESGTRWFLPFNPDDWGPAYGPQKYDVPNA